MCFGRGESLVISNTRVVGIPTILQVSCKIRNDIYIYMCVCMYGSRRSPR